MSAKNFLPEQYARDNEPEINHNYLSQQFADFPEILEKIAAVVERGDFTLGEAVNRCEEIFAERVGARFAIGVGSGTDALMLSLKALGIGEGDEVITTPYTFYATIGAIVTAGAVPVFVDVKNDYNIDEARIEGAVTPRTKALMPVHWGGRPCDMPELRNIADRHNLTIVQDACHAVEAKLSDRHLVTYGDTACYSLHPLKNLNVWGDGGFVTTQDEKLASRISLIRNHGLRDRDTCEEFAYNSRLDTIQAVVATHLMQNKLSNTTARRIENARWLDEALADIPEITRVRRFDGLSEVFHLYQINVPDRDTLKHYLIDRGVDAKVHYPVPMHLQPAASSLGYRHGDFPVAESLAASTLSLPVHEFITEADRYKMVQLISEFFSCRN